jgi:kumamolisin
MKRKEGDMTAVPQGYARLEGSGRRLAKGARLVGSADAHEKIEVSIHIRHRPDSPPLPTQADWAAIPPGQRTYLSREEFATRHGAAQSDIDRILAFASARGLTVVEISVPRRTVVVSGTVAQMNGAFAVALGQYESPNGEYRGREGHVHLPTDLLEVIKGVFGLDNRRMAHRAGGPGTPGAFPSLTPVQVAKIYNFPTPARAESQTIGLLEFSDPLPTSWIKGVPKLPRKTAGYDPADIDAYFTTDRGIGPGATRPSLTDVSVLGARNFPGGGEDSDDHEVVLDIDVAGAVAPGAKIVVYFAPNTANGWFMVVANAIHDKKNNPTVISISWGWAEDPNEDLDYSDATTRAAPLFENQPNPFRWGRDLVQAMSALFHEAAVLGITVLVASGDQGSNSDVPDGQAHVCYPASDPWITCVGGTEIVKVPIEEARGPTHSFVDRTWRNATGITGGGISDIFALPAWQASAVGDLRSVNDGNHMGRGIPDIAGYANGYSIVLGGMRIASAWNAGTSGAAPLYAGLIALLNERLGYSVGYLTSMLYPLANAFPEVVRDINDGVNNSSPGGDTEPPDPRGAPGYPANAGWDACTGLGVVDGDKLLAALQTIRRARLHGQWSGKPVIG